MTRLAMQQAPAPAIVRRFLLSASLWGVAAGALLAVDGGTALVSRWGGSTLALVHAVVLGVLGNAMFGSLLQFLPVAGGVRVRGGAVAARLLHGLLNLGALLLVLALRWPAALSPALGGGLLLAAFVLLAALLLPGLAAAAGQAFLRVGIGSALVAALVTAVLGFGLTLGLAGALPLSLPTWVDVHAGWGVLGWVLGLLAAVGRIVMPMFQGAAAAPLRVQGLWQLSLAGVLLAALGWAARGGDPAWLRTGAGLLGLGFALGGLLLQWRGPKLRRAPLTGFWMAGLVALAAAASLLLAGGEPNALRAGVLALGIGLPLLVAGMQLEIAAFLGWIGLQRRCGRGVHLPGVQLLLPVRDKRRVLVLHGVAALALLLALLRPALARAAGSALLLAHAASWIALCGVDRRAARFLRDVAGKQA